jgi:drug/metabolite transporter (DMT)-like permease
MCYSCGRAVRGLTRTEASASIVFYTALFMTLGALSVLPFFWKTPGPIDLAMFCSVGLIGGVSQFWVTQALHYAPTAAVSPFNYTALVWGHGVGLSDMGRRADRRGRHRCPDRDRERALSAAP